jgi:hypothetical protein
MTRLWVGRLGFDSRCVSTSLFATRPRLALGPTQPPVRGYQDKAVGLLTQSRTEVKNAWSYTTTSPYLHGIVVNLTIRYSFSFTFRKARWFLHRELTRPLSYHIILDQDKFCSHQHSKPTAPIGLFPWNRSPNFVHSFPLSMLPNSSLLNPRDLITLNSIKRRVDLQTVKLLTMKFSPGWVYCSYIYLYEIKRSLHYVEKWNTCLTRTFSLVSALHRHNFCLCCEWLLPIKCLS